MVDSHSDYCCFGLPVSFMQSQGVISILSTRRLRSAQTCPPSQTPSVQRLNHQTRSCVITEPCCLNIQCTAAVWNDTQCIWYDLATAIKSDTDFTPRDTETADTCAP